MGMEKVGQFAVTVVIAAAVAGHLDSLNRWVQVATAKLVWESRTSTWGSPRFFPEGYSAPAKVTATGRSSTRKPKTDQKIHSESRSN